MTLRAECRADRRDLLRLGMLLLASQAAYLVLARLDARSGAGPVLGFLGLLAFLFAGYAAAARIILARKRGSRAGLGLIVVGGLLFRVTLLPAGLPPGTASSEVLSALADDLAGRRVAFERFLLYDDDVWRYLWDGHAAAEGVNPYRHAPGDAAADGLAEGEGVNALWIDVRDNVNHPEVPTIYPPLAQAIFLLSHALTPGSVLALKMLMVGADLLAAVFVALSLRVLGRREEEVLLYLWNPLVIKEFAGSAHADSLLVAALAAILFFLLRGRRLAAAVSFAFAVLAKLAPIVLLPFLARRVGARAVGVAVAVVLAGYVPFLDSGLFAGLSAFARDWRFNSGPFLLLSSLFTPRNADPDHLARMVAAAFLLATLAYLLVRDAGRPEDFARVAAAALGALVLLSPAVMPWYVTWLLPLAVVGGESAWLVFSGLVCLAFLVMVDGRERPAVLLLEYGALAAFVTTRLYRYRRPFAMKCRSAVLTVALIGLPAAALAQGSGSHGPVVRPPTYGDSLENFNVLRSFEGTLHAVDEKEGAVIVDEVKTGRRVSFLLDRKLKLKADKKSELGGRKDLSLADLRPGQAVKLTVRTTDAAVVELRVRAPRT